MRCYAFNKVTHILQELLYKQWSYVDEISLIVLAVVAEDFGND